jgi:hypothetical protein
MGAPFFCALSGAKRNLAPISAGFVGPQKSPCQPRQCSAKTDGAAFWHGSFAATASRLPTIVHPSGQIVTGNDTGTDKKNFRLTAVP